MRAALHGGGDTLVASGDATRIFEAPRERARRVVDRAGCAPRVVHVTTTDISLVLLLGRQLAAMQAAGYEVIGVSAPGPYVDRLAELGVRHVPLQHATRSMAPLKDVAALGELARV